MKIKKSRLEKRKKKNFYSRKTYFKQCKELSDKRQIIINAFEKKDIIPRDLKPEPDREQLKPPEETIAERTKLRR